MAYLRIRRGKKTSSCDGFLVAENFVLTAAHYQGEDITVTLGAHDISKWRWSRQNIHVRRKIPHPKFDKDTLNNDIMLLELSRGAVLNNWVCPIALPRHDEKVKPRTMCSIAGWGRSTRKRDLFTNRLKEADVVVLGDETCLRNRDWPYRHYDPSTMMCVGHSEMSQDFSSCGFGGGPLVCEGRAHGIISWGAEDGTQSTVCTRVAAFIPWIQETMKS